MADINRDENDLLISSNLMTRHCMGIAATGGGKTNFLNLVLKQQMMRGGGAIHIDGKNSKESILEFLNLARQHDRWQDVRIINIADPTLSNTYNPLLRGDADELTSRIMDLIAGGGDPFFRGQASRGMKAISGVLKAMNLPFNFGDLNALMSDERAMRWVVDNGPKHTKEYVDYMTFFNQLFAPNPRTGTLELNERKMQHTFGDLGSRLHSYYVGAAGRVLNDYTPELDLYQAMKENLLVYVALPMLQKKEIAVEFAKFFISDLRTAVGQIQDDNYKPSPTFLVLMDEFSSYAMPSLAALFEQARSANVCLFPFIQTISSLSDKENGLSQDFASKILGNTWNKISFVLQDPESCEVMSRVAGESLQESVSESFGDSMSFAGGEDDASVLRTGGRGRSYGRSVSHSYEAIVRPEDFKNLDTGEAVFIGRQDVMKLKVPLVKLDNSDKNLDFPKFRLPQQQGVGLAEKFHDKAK